MSILTAELADLLLKFVRGGHREEGTKARIPQKFELACDEANAELAVDAARYLLFKGGIVQALEFINGLDDESFERFHLEAYDGVLMMVNFALLPLPFPRSCYEDCVASALVLAEVADEMATDLGLLRELFAPLLKYDKFVADLLEISDEVYGPGGRSITEDIRVQVCRSDFFVHTEGDAEPADDEFEFCKLCHYERCLCRFATGPDGAPPKEKLEFKLVELNLSAASVSHHAGIVHKVHDRLLKTNLLDGHEDDRELTKRLTLEKERLHGYNYPNRTFTKSMQECHELYLRRYPPIFGEKNVCLFAETRDNLNNYYDTYFMSGEVYEEFGLHVKAVTTKLLLRWMRSGALFLASEWEHNADGTVTFTKFTRHPDRHRPGRLVLNLGRPGHFEALKKSECHEVSVVYFRDFYDSELMAAPERVELRRMLEFADAVKSPNTLAQLVNTKRAQLYFSQPENMERLIARFNARVKGVRRNAGAAALAQSTAVVQVDPSQADAAEVVRDAIEHPAKYILKNNREAGHACLFGAELAETLSAGLEKPDALCQYVLMGKIQSPKQPALFVRHCKNGAFSVEGHPSVTELGVFHYALFDGNECRKNEAHGYLARTKPEFATGGGVSAGYGYVNSLLMF